MLTILRRLVGLLELELKLSGGSSSPLESDELSDPEPTTSFDFEGPGTSVLACRHLAKSLTTVFTVAFRAAARCLRSVRLFFNAPSHFSQKQGTEPLFRLIRIYCNEMSSQQSTLNIR